MGRISACVFSMNFLRSLLEKGHQVSPQWKRRDQILEALSISQAAPRGTAVTTSPQALAFCPKNPGSSSDSATWTLCKFCKTPAEQCWWEVGGNRGWERIPSWDLHWDWKLFLVWWPGGGVPNGCPFCLGSRAGDPWAPSSSPRCPGRRCSPSLTARHVQQRSFADQCFSSAPVLSQRGGQQDTASLVMISLALLCGLVWVCCFSHHPWSTAAVWRGKLSLQHWLGILRSAVPVSRPLSLAPEIPFPTDAFHARTWICSLWSLYSNLFSLRFGLPDLRFWALVSVPNTPLGSAYSLNLIPAKDKSSPTHCSSIWLHVLGFIHWTPWKPFDQSFCTAGDCALQVKDCWCIWFLPTVRSHSEQTTVAEKNMQDFYNLAVLSA